MPASLTPHRPDHTTLFVILLHLGASSADQVQLHDIAGQLTSLYRATHGSRWAYVDRSIAIALREHGAVWLGELSRDPCAIA